MGYEEGEGELFSNLDPVCYTEAVDRAIEDLVSLDEPYDHPRFDPLEFLNDRFPDEQSLVGLDAFISSLDEGIAQADQEMRDTVRLQATTTSQVERNVGKAKGSIGSLFVKVEEIRRMAEESEEMVMDICLEISSLDHAKKNLSDAITTLQNIKFLVQSLDDLQAVVDAESPDLSLAADKIGTCTEIMKGFESKQAIPRISDLRDKLKNLRQLCKHLAMHELEKHADPCSGVPVPPTLVPACAVVEALGDDCWKAAREAMVKCNIEKYKLAFPPSSDESRLEKLQRRFAWFRRFLKGYEESLRDIIPSSWNVPQEAAVDFCLVTQSAISEQLATDMQNINVEILIRVLLKAIQFEDFLTNAMKELEQGGSTFDVDDETSQGVAAAIKAKYQKKRASKSDDTSPEKRGQYKYHTLITSCFQNHMDVYVKHEDEKMRTLLQQAFMEEIPLHDEPVEQPISMCLLVFQYIRDSLKLCSSLCKGDTFISMYRVWVKHLSEVSAELVNRIPTKVADDEADKLVCRIINSADWSHDTSVKLAEEVKTKADEVYRSAINDEEAADHFRTVINKGVNQLIVNLDKLLTPAINEMVSCNWSQFTEVGDQSPYVSDICVCLSEKFTVLGSHLHPHLLRFVSDKFVSNFMPRYISCIYKLRRVNGPACQQLQMDLQILKALLPDLPNMGKADRFSARELRGYNNIIKRDVGRGEGILKFLAHPHPANPSDMSPLETYKELVKDPSIQDFAKLLDLKGVAAKDMKPLLEHAARTKSLPQTSQKDLSNYQLRSAGEVPPGDAKEISETLKHLKDRWGDRFSKLKDNLKIKEQL